MNSVQTKLDMSCEIIRVLHMTSQRQESGSMLSGSSGNRGVTTSFVLVKELVCVSVEVRRLNSRLAA